MPLGYSSQGLKAIKKQSCYGYWSGSSWDTKLLCRRTALNRCNATDRRWNKNEVSLSSPDTLLILWPRAEIKCEDDELNAPKFSTAIGWKIRLVGKLLYFINFPSAANSATIPTLVAALSTYDCASVLTTVTSQASDFPPCYEIKVSPSGRLPSCLTNPDGAFVAGMLAEPKDRQDLVSGNSTWLLFAHHRMEAIGIHLVTI